MQVNRSRLTMGMSLIVALSLTGCATSGEGGTASADSGASVRSVETVFGAVEVPSDPQRVVVVQSRALDLVTSLGVPTIGSTYWSAADKVPPYLIDVVPDDFVLVGNDDEPDFEAIAALQPDLIIGDEGIEPNLATFQDIAPVAAYSSENENGEFDWRTQLESVAEFVNRHDEADAVLADFETMVSELDADVTVPGQSVIALRVRPDHVRWHLPGTIAGSHVLSSMKNVVLPDSTVASENGSFSIIPPERLSVLSADRIIAFIDSREAYEALQQQSLWQNLPAVQSDGVCVTENMDAWILGGPAAAKAVADDVRSCLVG